MFAHVEACKNGNDPQKTYCKQYGIAYSTFQYWAKKYRKKVSEKGVIDRQVGFIPVKVQSEPEVLSYTPGVNQLHFLYPNGIQVMCPEGVHPEVLKNLINP